ncbi:MAG: methyltransferase domain-containing protein, partial [Cyanobacteria bacterium]|nr:methyltransferase domain-containing protein [Cyanobacteriota bacterium]
ISFSLENNTVWSFKSRGNWATHNGNYRGNWSPYIPRNIILKFSKENDIVLDYFCGAGTTGIECKLLNRNFIGVDINPQAIELAKSNLNFNDSLFFNSKINFFTGDARNLQFLESESIDLICAHPPYANIIKYTCDNPNDLSNLEPNIFLKEINKVAKESFRVLKPGKYCAILIGDLRRNKDVIPLGFWVIEEFIKEGFLIRELIIKRQHNCKTTGFWYTNSIKYNFLLLAHEYLVVFEKSQNKIVNQYYLNKNEPFFSLNDPNLSIDYNLNTNLESKTVWVFNKLNWKNNVIFNLIKRYSKGNFLIYNFDKLENKKYDLIIILNIIDLSKITDLIKNNLENDGILSIICEDIRQGNGIIYPSAINVEKNLRNIKEIKIKEIVIISLEGNNNFLSDENLKISHKYLLVYKKI